jgi:hypothetical protein
MGTRSDRMRDVQTDMERGPPPLTRAGERAIANRYRMGVVTYMLIGLAALSLVSAALGGGIAALASVLLWATLAWLNEHLRRRQRERAEG